jgi:hypothetical protein
VTLSGHVTDASGPVSGTSVIFNSESAVSDATGLYVLHVPPGTTSSLYFTAGSPAPGAVTQLTAVVENPGLTVGSVDVVEDLVWPTQASVHMSVVDATSTPLVGAVVHGEGGALTGTLSDGTTRVVFNYEMPTGGQTCTTDATGVCTLAALVGAQPSFYSSYQPVPNDPSYPTFYAGASPLVTAVDINATIQFANIAFVASAGLVQGQVLATTPAGTSFSAVSNQSAVLPSGEAVLTGELSYIVAVPTPGSSVVVTLTLPTGSNPTSVWKFQNGTYIDVSQFATFSGDTIKLTLTDGGLGDADGLANGIIVDPVIPARLAVPGAPTIGQATGKGQSASVSFTAPTKDGGSPVIDYTAACTSGNGGTSGSATGSGSPLVVGGLTNGSTYSCSVTARNAQGSGGPSTASNSFTPLALLSQTIKFGNLANKTMAQSPVTVSATASSGLAVTFTTSTPAVCTAGGANGATITLVGPGTCTVKADQPGNAVYNPAPTLSQSFRVSKLNQTITFGGLANKTMAHSPVTVHATASSGLAVTFTTSTPSVCTAGGTNGATITLVGPGTCTVKADQPGTAVYNPAPTLSQSFRVR